VAFEIYEVVGHGQTYHGHRHSGDFQSGDFDMIEDHELPYDGYHGHQQDDPYDEFPLSRYSYSISTSSMPMMTSRNSSEEVQDTLLVHDDLSFVEK